MKKEFERQRAFTNKVITTLSGNMPESYEDKITWTKEQILSLISECIELLNTLDWKKQWKEGKKLNIINLAFELIDIQKFLWGIAVIWGIDYQELIRIFNEKSCVVEHKFDQECMLKSKKFSNVCIIDIDGVISRYPEYYYDWAKELYGLDPTEITANKVLNEQLKHEYRLSGAKRNIPVVPGARESLTKLRELGYSIILLTNRPNKSYANIYYDTLYWLKMNELPFDYIFWSEGDVSKVAFAFNKTKDIKFVIDDSLNTCIEFNNLGVKTYYVSNEEAPPCNIITVKNISEIEEIHNAR